MKQYLRNLWLALTGADPFADEVATLKDRLERAGENVDGLREQLYAALSKWDGCQWELNKTKEQLAEANRRLEAAECTAQCKQLRSMQRLVENLRERGKEKDARLAEQGREFRDRMEQMKADYQRRIDEYVREIDQLRNASTKK